MNKALAPKDVIRTRKCLQEQAIDGLIVWFNNTLPKKFNGSGKDVFLNEQHAKEDWVFKNINMTIGIRTKVRDHFASAGWIVRFEYSQWWFNVPKNQDTDGVM